MQNNPANFIGVFMNKTKFCFCLLALALNVAFATQTLAILPSDGPLSDDELDLLTDKMREAALNVLPLDEFTLMKQDVVIKRLGGMESYMKECSETSCIVNLGKKAQVDYVAQCRVGKLGDDLRITVELYEVSTGGLLGMFSNVAEDFSKLPPMMSYRIPAVFRNITEQKQKATEPVAASVATSNEWNNWVYGEGLVGGGGGAGGASGGTNSLFGFGARYERMLSARISVGGGFHLGIPEMKVDKQGSSGSLYTTTISTEQAIKENRDEIDSDYDFDINAFFRLYPWAGAFYLGAGVGYHHSSNYIYSDSLHYSYYYNDNIFNGYYKSSGGSFYTAYKSGISITPEIGWKIDVGEDGGFYLNLGFILPIIIGEAAPDAAYFYDADYSLTKTKWAYDDEALEDFSKYPVVTMFYYFSVGYAF
jgi:TolB-like protein